MKIKLALSIIFFFKTYHDTIAFQLALDTPQVGKPMPEFVLNNITHFKKKEVSLTDFKGKWLFMDFWFTGCTTCIKSFPKTNDLQKAYKDKINWLMIGLNNSSSKAIESTYGRLSKMQRLEMISAYDSILCEKWNIHSFPHVLIIDPMGILRFITDGRDLTKEKIGELLEGKTISLFDKEKNEHLKTFELPSSNSKLDEIIYSSSISKWNGEKQKIYDVDQYIKAQGNKAYKNGFPVVMASLYMLYNMAYFGKAYLKYPYDSLYAKVYPQPVLEMKDTSLFEFDYDSNFGNGFGKGLYNYNILIPNKKNSKEKFLMLMQQDIARTFNYKANVETRNMPIWKLKAKPGTLTKYKTKGGESFNSIEKEISATGFTLQNKSVKEFLTILTYYLKEKTPHPFVDDTGIKSNVDISISTDLTNFEKTIEALHKLNLDLVLDKTDMQVLIIRDGK